MQQLSEWASHAQPDDFWITALVLLTLAAGGFIGAFIFFMRKRIMEDTPTSKIRSAAQGYVELIGYGDLMDGAPIVAPLTGKSCTWYSYKIEERRRSGKKTRWVTIDSGKSDNLFLLIDDTGSCIIDPEGASVTAKIAETWYGHSARPAGVSNRSGSMFSGGKYRYTEKRMHAKDDLFAIGLFNTVGGAGSEFDIDEDVRELLKEWKRNSSTLLARFDNNKNGQIDMEEWQEVRKAAFKDVLAQHSELKSAPAVNMMGKTCDRRRPYLLSAVSQESLIRRYNYYSGGLIVLFFFCGAIATFIINTRLSGI